MEIFREKADIEHAFALGEAGQAARDTYLRLLTRLNREALGVLDFRWPGLPFPLYMRAGSSDLSNFVQVFCNEEYGFETPHTPRRILDLGGYVGFAAIYLARRFPG